MSSKMEEKKRRIRLELPEQDYRQLTERLSSLTDGMSIKEILQGFLEDLAQTDRSNGSDERERAREWLLRAYGRSDY